MSTRETSGSADYSGYEIGAPTKQVDMPELDVQLLTVNEYSRPGIATDTIRSIVVHYTANPGSTAQNNRDYFENLKDTHETKVSSNFVIGLDGEIIQCVPTAEMAYASNERNIDSVSIECCHPDETGKFEDATYDSLVELVAFLCGKFDLGMDDIIRHYDVTGKDCPKYFVEHEDAWNTFKCDVAEYIQENGK
jgi:N-acetylmuramoyl-L-alanine amidase CwlA